MRFTVLSKSLYTHSELILWLCVDKSIPCPWGPLILHAVLPETPIGFLDAVIPLIMLTLPFLIRHGRRMFRIVQQHLILRVTAFSRANHPYMFQPHAAIAS